MKEFVMKHPFLSFLLADSAIAGTVKIVTTIVNAFTKNDIQAKTEVTIDGSADSAD